MKLSLLATLALLAVSAVAHPVGHSKCQPQPHSTTTPDAIPSSPYHGSDSNVEYEQHAPVKNGETTRAKGKYSPVVHDHKPERLAYPWEQQGSYYRPGHQPKVHIPGYDQLQSQLPGYGKRPRPRPQPTPTPGTNTTTPPIPTAIPQPKCFTCVAYTGAPNQPYVPGFGGQNLIKKPLPGDGKEFTMTLVHTNDIHSRLDEFSSSGLDCTEKNRAEGRCFGGIARIKTLVDLIREKDPNVYLVDAGDQFQGTMFYNYYKGNTTAEYMNMIKYDAFAIGNHEFDDGPAHLASFIAKLTTPALSSNMNTATDPNLNGLVAPFIVLTKYNTRLGVIGFITKATPTLAQVGKQLTFEDPVVSVQRAIDELHKLGVKRIIAVSHNGYEDDKQVAANTQGVSVIVGGHSHSLLLKNTTASGVAGPYPTEVKAKDGESVYIVQAKSLGEYVGKLSLTWSAANKLTAINGDPIQLTMNIPQHPATHAIVQEWRKPFDAIARTVIGSTSVALMRETCSITGCALGYWVANLLRASVATPAPEVAATFGMTNTGGLRADLPAGNVTIGGILAVLPFVNMATTVRFSGKQIVEMLEGLALMQNSDAIRPDGKKVTGFAQFAGLRANLDKSKPKWQRVSGVEVEVAKGKWAPVAADKLYDVVTVDYLSQGGGDSIIPAELLKQRDTRLLLSDMAIEAVKRDKEIKVVAEDFVPGVHFI